MRAQARDLFRPEAIEALEAGEGEHGAPLQLVPRWTRYAYWLLLLGVVVGVEFAVVAPVWDYADGRAVVQVNGRLDVTTSTGGTAITVAVRPDQRVVAGQFLVGFYTGAEQLEFDRASREFDLKLVQVLQDPSDEQARQALATLRAQRELAAAHIRERSVFAPSAGIVTNSRVREGQSLTAGDVVMTLIDDRVESSYSLVAFVPGQFRPMIHKGMAMRLELDGYPHVYTDVTVDTVGDEAVGPAEARRYLGPVVGDALPVEGSLLLVQGQLPKRTFEFDHDTYQYHDGIPGQVHVQVRSMRLIMWGFPFLREIFGHGRYEP